MSAPHDAPEPAPSASAFEKAILRLYDKDERALPDLRQQIAKGKWKQEREMFEAGAASTASVADSFVHGAVIKEIERLERLPHDHPQKHLADISVQILQEFLDEAPPVAPRPAKCYCDALNHPCFYCRVPLAPVADATLREKVADLRKLHVGVPSMFIGKLKCETCNCVWPCSAWEAVGDVLALIDAQTAGKPT